MDYYARLRQAGFDHSRASAAVTQFSESELRAWFESVEAGLGYEETHQVLRSGGRAGLADYLKAREAGMTHNEYLEVYRLKGLKLRDYAAARQAGAHHYQINMLLRGPLPDAVWSRSAVLTEYTRVRRAGGSDSEAVAAVRAAKSAAKSERHRDVWLALRAEGLSLEETAEILAG